MALSAVWGGGADARAPRARAALPAREMWCALNRELLGLFKEGGVKLMKDDQREELERASSKLVDSDDDDDDGSDQHEGEGDDDDEDDDDDDDDDDDGDDDDVDMGGKHRITSFFGAASRAADGGAAAAAGVRGAGKKRKRSLS